MKTILPVVFILGLVFFSYFYDPTVDRQTQKDLSTYIGYEVEIDKAIKVGTEIQYYVDFDSNSKSCSAIVGKEYDRYYYINIPNCRTMI